MHREYPSASTLDNRLVIYSFAYLFPFLVPMAKKITPFPWAAGFSGASLWLHFRRPVIPSGAPLENNRIKTKSKEKKNLLESRPHNNETLRATEGSVLSLSQPLPAIGINTLQRVIFFSLLFLLYFSPKSLEKRGPWRSFLGRQGQDAGRLLLCSSPCFQPPEHIYKVQIRRVCVFFFFFLMTLALSMKVD